MECIDRFVQAFNERDLAALAACLAEDATAVVEGSPFPVESGREAIRTTSLPYLLDESMALRAKAVDHPSIAIALLDAQGRLDVAIEAKQTHGSLASLRYFTMPHRPDDLRSIAGDLGLGVAE
ncbi:MAG: nuclear transport factor 2 family protein [Planctomycetota bacterium]|jgi:ketosteroid isomerase-like protein